jgi:GT2 family glycosyltransferase
VTNAAPDVAAVTAVVVNHNGGERTLRAVSALEAQTLRPREILLVDDASDDGSMELVAKRFPDVELVRLSENRGPAAARNAGLSRAGTPLVLFVDHDLYLEPDALEKLVHAWRETDATVVCPRIRLLPEREIVQADGAEPHFIGTLALRNGFTRQGDAPSRATEVRGAPSGCLLVVRERVLAAGGFDELYFFYFEDLEFSLRLRALGHRFVVEPGAVVYHERGAGTPGLAFRGEGVYPAKRLYLTLRNRLLTMLVYYRLRTLFLLAPILVLYEAASLALLVQRGGTREWLRAWQWQLTHRHEILERRRRIQRERLLPDRDLLSGGTLPMAPGLLRSRFSRGAIAVLSRVLESYWLGVKRWVG